MNKKQPTSSTTSITTSNVVHDPLDIPANDHAGPLPLESYPNILGITSSMRHAFHPVVEMDPAQTTILDLSRTTGQSQLIPLEQQQTFIQNRTNERRNNNSMQNNKHKHEEITSQNMNVNANNNETIMLTHYTIGKFDEDRVNLYSSQLFEDDENEIGGYKGARTLHVGVDLGAPVGEYVYSFWDGVVHSVGYNSDLGDYGYVIVMEYDLSLCKAHDNINGASASASTPLVGLNGFEKELDRFWVLYGHLDKSTVERNRKGDQVKRGDILGRIGDVDENGGWSIPHVHFQVATFPPETHDMPGAVTVQDRTRALMEDFPDPRWILGDIY